MSWANRGPTDANRTRGRKWQAIRRRILERDKWQCVKCSTDAVPVLADEVDHIVPIARGGGDEDANLQSLCEPCHKTKSRSEGVNVGRDKPPIGLDGWPTTTTR